MRKFLTVLAALTFVPLAASADLVRVEYEGTAGTIIDGCADPCFGYDEGDPIAGWFEYDTDDLTVSEGENEYPGFVLRAYRIEGDGPVDSNYGSIIDAYGTATGRVSYTDSVRIYDNGSTTYFNGFSITVGASEWCGDDHPNLTCSSGNFYEFREAHHSIAFSTNGPPQFEKVAEALLSGDGQTLDIPSNNQVANYGFLGIYEVICVEPHICTAGNFWDESLEFTINRITFNAAAATVTDGDGIDDAVDNCPTLSNPAQTDTDSDGLGNVCDADDDNDGLLDVEEDSNGNGAVDSGETDPLDPDSDNDGIGDAYDNDPLTNNSCNAANAIFDELQIVGPMTCAAANSITVSPLPGSLVEVLASGDLHLIAPSVSFEGGFRVLGSESEGYGSLTVTSADPCPGCGPVPHITDISPDNGRTAGGDSVTIYGSNFQLGVAVYFDGVPGTELVIVTGGELTVTTPPNPVGPADVIVMNPSGQLVECLECFTYIPPPTITEVTPSSGSILGGTTVTITGFYFHQAVTVTFGGAEATISSVNPTSVVAESPAHAAGAVDVVVTSPDGQTGTLTGGFEYF